MGIPLLPYSVQQKQGKKEYRGYLSKYHYGNSRRRTPQLIQRPEFDKHSKVVPQLKSKVKERYRLDAEYRVISLSQEKKKQGIYLGKHKRIRELEAKVKLLELEGGEKDMKQLDGQVNSGGEISVKDDNKNIDWKAWKKERKEKYESLENH